MKKFLILSSFYLMCSSSFAQLKVDSLGKVGVGGPINNSYTMTISPVVANGLLINNTSQASSMTGLEIITKRGSTSQATGIYLGPGSNTTTQNIYGTRSVIGMSSGNSYGVSGVLFNYGNNFSVKGAGIYGASTLDGADFAYPGSYAGYFKGDVRVTGTLYATVSTPTANSTSSNATPLSISTLSDTQELRVVDRLQGVQLLLLENNDNYDKSMQSSRTMVSNTTNLFDKDVITQEILDEYSKTSVPQKTVVTYGLAADQLKEVYPNLVVEDSEGNVSVNYIEMIPLLVQSINELNAKIEELENENLTLMSRGRNSYTNISEQYETQVISISQNNPNPFNERTSIEMNIPETTNKAMLFIYDMNGKKIKQIDVLERGDVEVVITSEGLEAGMYLYSLIADGKIVNTKRMVLN